MDTLQEIKSDLRKNANQKKDKFLATFFRKADGSPTSDKFLGITVPSIRAVVKKHKESSIQTAESLIVSKYHEEKLCGLLLLVSIYKRGDMIVKEKVVESYLKHLSYVDNWDLVDSSSYSILGDFLFERDRKILYKLAQSSNVWERRIAVVSTMHFIRKGDIFDTFKLARVLVHDREPYIHKAVGWLIREAGKKDRNKLIDFLNEFGKTMPRTMLRYAIEHFDADIRAKYLKAK